MVKCVKFNIHSLVFNVVYQLDFITITLFNSVIFLSGISTRPILSMLASTMSSQGGLDNLGGQRLTINFSIFPGTFRQRPRGRSIARSEEMGLKGTWPMVNRPLDPTQILVFLLSSEEGTTSMSGIRTAISPSTRSPTERTNPPLSICANSATIWAK